MKIRAFQLQDENAVIDLWLRCGLVSPQNNPCADIQRKLAVAPELFLVGEESSEVVATIMVGYEGHRGWLNYSISYDSHEKLETYRRAGVAEYILWRTEEQALDWMVLIKGHYVALKPDAAGIIRSPYFRGLWLNVPALLAPDRRAILNTLNQGLANAGWL